MYKCPNCGSDELFGRETVYIEFFDGNEMNEGNPEFEEYLNSRITCANCGYTEDISEFKVNKDDEK